MFFVTFKQLRRSQTSSMWNHFVSGGCTNCEERLMWTRIRHRKWICDRHMRPKSTLTLNWCTFNRLFFSLFYINISTCTDMNLLDNITCWCVKYSIMLALNIINLSWLKLLWVPSRIYPPQCMVAVEYNKLWTLMSLKDTGITSTGKNWSTNHFMLYGKKICLMLKKIY